jgi:hypothetical protein
MALLLRVATLASWALDVSVSRTYGRANGLGRLTHRISHVVGVLRCELDDAISLDAIFWGDTPDPSRDVGVYYNSEQRFPADILAWFRERGYTA